jgi:hypothetical protein
MRKLALLLAAALIVSAPMLTTMPTDSFAAAKEKAKTEGKMPDNRGFFDALGDNLGGKSVAAKKDDKKGGKKAKKGKKSAKKGGMGGMGGMGGAAKGDKKS